MRPYILPIIQPSGPGNPVSAAQTAPLNPPANDPGRSYRLPDPPDPRGYDGSGINPAAGGLFQYAARNAGASAGSGTTPAGFPWWILVGLGLLLWGRRRGL